MKRVSSAAGVSVSGEVAASRRRAAGSHRGMGPPPTPEPQRARPRNVRTVLVFQGEEHELKPPEPQRVNLSRDMIRRGYVADLSGEKKKEREQKQFGKAPTSEQWTMMAGSMYNALERLRNVSADWRRRADANEGWLQPGHVEIVMKEIDATANILRVGLKARTKK